MTTTPEPRRTRSSNTAFGLGMACGTMIAALLAGFFIVASDKAAAEDAAEPAAAVVNEDPAPLVDALPTPTTTAVPVAEPVNEDPLPAWAGLPACETEDADNCYWDAAVQGNGHGQSFYVIDGQYTLVGEPINEDYTLESWPFTTGETIVCGQGAKPAIDYSDDPEIGYWAYCEPALVQK